MNPSKENTGESGDARVFEECLERGDQQSWANFFAHFEQPIRRSIRAQLRTRSEADRDDVYQMVALKILSGKVLPKYKSGKNPRAFLHAVVRNLARNYYKRSLSRYIPLADDEKLPDQLRLIADRAPPQSERNLIEVIDQRLAALGTNEKQLAIYDAFLDEMSIDEVIEKTGVSQATTYRSLVRLQVIVHEVLGLPVPAPEKTRGTVRKTGAAAGRAK